MQQYYFYYQIKHPCQQQNLKIKFYIQNSKHNMGGCFRPSLSKSPIHIQLIDKVVNEALKPPNIQLPASPTERIHKKGDLRKLIDHLSSHKYNIYYSLVYLAKLLNDPANNEAVLIVANELMKSLPIFLSQQFSHPLSKKKKKKSKKSEQTASKINMSSTRQIEINFQIMYFPIIMTVFDTDQSLRVRVMESVRWYAESRKQKFTQDRFVSRMLARLLIQLKTDRLVKQSIQTYNSLIIKSNIYLAENESNHEALFIVINIWLSNADSQIKRNCSSIIKIYIFNCMQEREYLQLFTVILSIYDKYQFKQNVLSSLETDLLILIEQQQMKQQFLKSLFRYLLVYLSLSEDNRVRQNWQKVIFTIPYIQLKSNHDFILTAQSKINGMNTLTRWIKLAFIDINQLITFNRLSLYSCFKFNILSQTNQILLTKVLTTFVDVYLLCSESSKFLLTEMLFEDIHFGTNMSLNQLKSLIWLARKFITLGLVIDDVECFNFFKPLECVPEERLKIQQIVLMYSLLLDSCKMPYNYNIIQSLCDVSYSFYQILDIHQSTIKEKYYMVQSVLHFMKKLNHKGYSDFILLWVRGIPKPKKPSSITRYFDKLLTLQIWELLTAVKRVPDEMIQLNKQMETMSNADIIAEIWVYQKSHPEIKVASRLSPVEQNPNQMSPRYLFIKEKFERLIKKDRMIDLSDDGDKDKSPLQVKRRSSIVASEHSYKTDESFQEIYGMISSKNEEKLFYKTN